MNYAEKLFEKPIKIKDVNSKVDSDYTRASYLLGYNQMKLDLVSAFLDKNKEFELMRDNGSDPSYVIPREALAFREFAKKCEELGK